MRRFYVLSILGLTAQAGNLYAGTIVQGFGYDEIMGGACSVLAGATLGLTDEAKELSRDRVKATAVLNAELKCGANQKVDRVSDWTLYESSYCNSYTAYIPKATFTTTAGAEFECLAQ